MKTIIQTALLLVNACAALAQVTPVVVPNSNANMEGNSSASDVMVASSFRLQMVFDGSEFAFLSSAPGVTNALSTISFRIDGTSSDNVLSLFDGGSVTLSVTPRGPDDLSPIFADNVGANPMTVFTGALQFGRGYVPGANPQPFAISIIATSPFYYSPAQGNLLLDIIAGGGHVLFPGSLDAQLATGDGISRVFASSEIAASGTADTLGLVTRFNFVVIPEPSPTALAMLGTGMVLLIIRKRVGGTLD